MPDPLHDQVPPDPWVARFSRLIPDGGAVLDLAAGAGRHAMFLSERGYSVTAVDRDISRLTASGPAGIGAIEALEADLEAGGWPLPGRQFAGIVVANYLHRPLFPHLLGALAPGGVLIYRTFQAGNEKYGRPRNPEFLLRPRELIAALRGLEIRAYEAGEVRRPAPAVIQRICAIRPPA